MRAARPVRKIEWRVNVNRTNRMSILGEVSGGGGGNVWSELLLIAPLCLVSLAVAWWAGVFRRGSIVGPPRLSQREPLAIMVMVMACTFVLWMMAQIICVVAGASVRGAPSTISTSAPTTTAPTFESKFVISPRTMALASSLPGLIGAAVMVIAHALLRRDGLRTVGIALSQLPRGILYGLVGTVIMVPLVFLSAELTELAWRAVHYTHPTEHELLRVMNEAKGLTVVVLIASAVLIAPIFEEMFFRGHVQTVLTYVWSRIERWRKRSSPGAPSRGFEVILPPEQALLAQMAPPDPPPPELPKAWSRWLAVILTALLFSLVHPVWSMPPIFLLAVCLGYAYERTGNLWTTITMHAMFNTTSTLLFIFTR
jgi:membrane protease YdiL (CAAX protease family)